MLLVWFGKKHFFIKELCVRIQYGQLVGRCVVSVSSCEESESAGGC